MIVKTRNDRYVQWYYQETYSEYSLEYTQDHSVSPPLAVAKIFRLSSPTRTEPLAEFVGLYTSPLEYMWEVREENDGASYHPT